MTEVQHLDNAPIKEALIDIRVSSSIGLDALDGIHKLIEDRYPKKVKLRVSRIGFDFSEDQEPVTTHDQQHLGYRYETDDGRNVLQLKLDGFTFSRLEPYEDWESMVNEAKDLWNIYTQIVQPDSVIRIAVRYINSITLSLPITDFDEYITAPPIIPEELPQTLSGFLTRVNITNAELNSYCIVTQTVEESDGNNVVIVLDIDAVIADENTVGDYVPPYDKLWEDFGKLRDFKNRVFFNSITEATAEMFK